MRSAKSKQQESDPAVVKRLDALLRLTLESLLDRKSLKNEGDAARLFRSLGLTPTEIATIVSKKSATDVSKYLYSNK
jgi:hypothetical protein